MGATSAPVSLITPSWPGRCLDGRALDVYMSGMHYQHAFPERPANASTASSDRRPPMAVREGLLALLREQESYGYQLKTGFERATGGVWPLNVGQVYKTLDRLERDGLVTSTDHEGQRSYI